MISAPGICIPLRKKAYTCKNGKGTLYLSDCCGFEGGKAYHNRKDDVDKRNLEFAWTWGICTTYISEKERKDLV